jgi:hypothetical protein
VADQYDVVQVFDLGEADDVLGVGVEVDVGSEEMGAVGNAGQRQGMDVMALAAQPAGHLAPRPRADPHARDQDVCAHAEKIRANTGQVPPGIVGRISAWPTPQPAS